MFQSPTESIDKLLSTISKREDHLHKIKLLQNKNSTIRKTHHTTFCSITA